MTHKISKNNNKLLVKGTVVSPAELSHEVFGENFYNIKISISRISDSIDTIDVLISERSFDINDIKVGDIMRLEGEYRSFNKYIDGKSQLQLFAYVHSAEKLDSEPKKYDNNKIYLSGFLCTKPKYRKTPLGREVADMMVAVNRSYGKTDYIPCIAWGRNALYASNLNIGDNVRIEGRVQSRIYVKKDDEFNEIKKTAYEVSVSNIRTND